MTSTGLAQLQEVSAGSGGHHAASSRTPVTCETHSQVQWQRGLMWVWMKTIKLMEGKSCICLASGMCFKTTFVLG